MFGHLSFGVRDLDRAMAFYDAVMAPLGAVRVWSGPKGAGYGPPWERALGAVFHDVRDGCGTGKAAGALGVCRVVFFPLFPLRHLVATQKLQQEKN